MPAQGEYRGPQGGAPRKGGGDWDAHASDAEIWIEPEPGELCTWCHATYAPIGSSLCTPCYRARVRLRNRLNARQAVSTEAWERSRRDLP